MEHSFLISQFQWNKSSINSRRVGQESSLNQIEPIQPIVNTSTLGLTSSFLLVLPEDPLTVFACSSCVISLNYVVVGDLNPEDGEPGDKEKEKGDH